MNRRDALQYISLLLVVTLVGSNVFYRDTKVIPEYL